MESIIRKLRIQTLRAQSELRRLQGESFAKKLSAAATDEQRTDLAREWDKAIQAKHATRLMMDLMERQEREDKPPDKF